MSIRLNLSKSTPVIYQGLTEIDKQIAASDLDPWHREMIRIKASQLNGCAYCVDKHTQDALALGVHPRKIDLVCVWREAKKHFSDEEQLILRLTEEITWIGQHGVSDEVFGKCIAAFGEERTGRLIVAAIVINAWNRIGVSLKMEPAF